MRRNAPTPDWRPCSDAFVTTADGWKLGVRHLRPAHPDPNKLPVVLCHGLGLNATFWTITEHHLPQVLMEHGYEVYLFDFRASGESCPPGRVGKINERLRQTFLLELGEGKWTVDEIVRYDVPAVLDYVEQTSGHHRVNWVGHSLGGMLMVPYLELAPPSRREQIATFVGMGATIVQAETPQLPMLRANRALRNLARVASTGRMGRPLMYGRFPGLSQIDKFYYTASNVDESTISRFYGYTLEDIGRSALLQLDPYLEFGHFVSADRRIDYAARLGEVTVPTLLVAGDADIMSDVPSTVLMYKALGSPDKTLARYGKAEGHVADYGHCDLVWSRYAPREVFPYVIDWLDRRQPVAPSPQTPAPQRPPLTAAPAPSKQATPPSRGGIGRVASG
jgi:lysosomal acid lipase/cholesteryl ester hydrolase